MSSDGEKIKKNTTNRIKPRNEARKPDFFFFQRPIHVSKTIPRDLVLMWQMEINILFGFLSGIVSYCSVSG